MEHFGTLILILGNVMKKNQIAASEISFSQFSLKCLWHHRNLRETPLTVRPIGLNREGWSVDSSYLISQREKSRHHKRRREATWPLLTVSPNNKKIGRHGFSCRNGRNTAFHFPASATAHHSIALQRLQFPGTHRLTRSDFQFLNVIRPTHYSRPRPIQRLDTN